MALLFWLAGTDYQAFNSDSPKYSVNGKYLSIGTVFSYECFSNFRLGVGADVAWYVNRLGASTYNSKKMRSIYLLWQELVIR